MRLADWGSSRGGIARRTALGGSGRGPGPVPGYEQVTGGGSVAKRRRKYGLSWSWKRAVGLSGLKGKVSRKTRIPLTTSGRERKVGRIVLGALGLRKRRKRRKRRSWWS